MTLEHVLRTLTDRLRGNPNQEVLLKFDNDRLKVYNLAIDPIADLPLSLASSAYRVLSGLAQLVEDAPLWSKPPAPATAMTLETALQTIRSTLEKEYPQRRTFYLKFTDIYLHACHTPIPAASIRLHPTGTTYRALNGFSMLRDGYAGSLWSASCTLEYLTQHLPEPFGNYSTPSPLDLSKTPPSTSSFTTNASS